VTVVSIGTVLGPIFRIGTHSRLSINYRLKIHLISVRDPLSAFIYPYFYLHSSLECGECGGSGARSTSTSRKAFKVDLSIDRLPERRELTHEKGPIGAQGCVRELDNHQNGPYLPNLLLFGLHDVAYRPNRHQSGTYLRVGGCQTRE